MDFIDHSFELSVLIPCYNNFDGLIRSIKSISYYADKCCIVVVDDGSASEVREAEIRRHIDINIKIFVIRLEQNKGITNALNTGLRWIRDNKISEFIARLDCSDICCEDRLQKQVSFLKKRPEIGLLGSWCTFELPDGKSRFVYTTPTEHQAIEKEMYFRNVFIHPTVMFRTKIIEVAGFYPEHYLHVEDYAYFWKLVLHTQVAIIPEFLVTCEINYKGISIENRLKQLQSRYKVVADFGTKYWLKVLGQIKLNILMVVPNSLIIKLKELRS